MTESGKGRAVSAKAAPANPKASMADRRALALAAAERRANTALREVQPTAEAVGSALNAIRSKPAL
jgi:hypothetical protein